MIAWLRMSELVARLGRAESTLLLWHRTYTPWLPRRQDEEGVFVYPLGPYEEVAELTAEYKHPNDVRRALALRHGEVDVDLARMGSTLTLVTRLAERMEVMHRDLVERLERIERRLDRN